MAKTIIQNVDKFPRWDESLHNGALAMGLKLEKENLDRFQQYALLLQKWGRKMDLSSQLEPDEIISRHFLDSLSLLKAYPVIMNASLLDIGSGAGFPGIPLKIVRPDLIITLTESSRKKAFFCSLVIKTLGLVDISVKNARAEELSLESDFKEKYDLSVSRAAASISKLLELSHQPLKKGGILAAYKGPGEGISFIENLQESPEGWKYMGERAVSVPGRDSPRVLVIFLKKPSPAFE